MTDLEVSAERGDSGTDASFFEDSEPEGVGLSKDSDSAAGFAAEGSGANGIVLVA